MLTIFNGIESRDHRRTLLSVRELFEGRAPTIAAGIGYRSLRARRSGQQYVKEVAEAFPVVMESAYATASLDRDGAKEAQVEYYSFLESVPEVTTAIQFEHPALLREDRILPEDPRIVPVLFDPDDPDALAAMLGEHNAVAMSYGGDKRIPPVLRRGSNADTVAISLSASDLEVAKTAGFNVMSTGSWFVPGQYGESVVWNGKRVVRGKAPSREVVLREQRSWIMSAGFDLDLLEGDDAREWNRLAVYSYLLWGASLAALETPKTTQASDGSKSSIQAPSENPESASVAPSPKYVKRSREQITLPVLFAEPSAALEPDQYGGASIRTRNVMRASGETLRVCDTCFLASTCPAHEPGATCAFNLPVEIRTDAQAKALMYTMVEIQASRVAFARFAEELNGGYPDPVVGQEMDRLVRMTERVTKPNERRERLTVSVEAESSGDAPGAGVLSRIFGGGAPAPVEQTPMTVLEDHSVSAD